MQADIADNDTRIERLEATIEQVTTDRDQWRKEKEKIQQVITDRDQWRKEANHQKDNAALLLILLVGTLLIAIVAITYAVISESHVDQPEQPLAKLQPGHSYQILRSPFLVDEETGTYQAFAKTDDQEGATVVELPALPPDDHFLVVTNQEGELEMQPRVPHEDETIKKMRRLAWFELQNWIETRQPENALDFTTLYHSQLHHFSDQLSIQYQGLQETETGTRLQFIIVHKEAHSVSLPAFKEPRTGTIFGTINLEHQGIPYYLIVTSADQHQIKLAVQDSNQPNLPPAP